MMPLNYISLYPWCARMCPKFKILHTLKFIVQFGSNFETDHTEDGELRGLLHLISHEVPYWHHLNGDHIQLLSVTRSSYCSMNLFAVKKLSDVGNFYCNSSLVCSILLQKPKTKQKKKSRHSRGKFSLERTQLGQHILYWHKTSKTSFALMRCNTSLELNNIHKCEYVIKYLLQ